MDIVEKVKQWGHIRAVDRHLFQFKISLWGMNTFCIFIIGLVMFYPMKGLADRKNDDSALIQTIIKGTEATYAGNYDLARSIFDSIQTLNPEHPSREFYLASVLFWKTNIDPNNPIYDQQITELLESSIRKSEVMLAKNPDDIEALHYIGIAYTYSGRLDAHRGRYFSGGSKGETGRKYLEHAINICEQSDREKNNDTIKPGMAYCEDLYFPFGAYAYFAGRLPSFLKAFSFLWFLPSGSTEEGLAALERSSKNSRLHGSSAQLLLTSIYTAFENERLDEALEMLDRLTRRYPDNAYLDLQYAYALVASDKFNDAFQRADGISAKTVKKVPNYNKIVAFQSELIKALVLIMKSEFDQAAQMLNKLAADNAYQSNSHTAQIDLLLAMIADARGKRDQAIALYDKTLDYDTRYLSQFVKAKAREYKKSPFIPPVNP